MWITSVCFLAAVIYVQTVQAAGPDEWRTRSIYQVITDRFARPDDSNASCNSEDMAYCGGTYQGIVKHLDYIQGMGFDSVRIPMSETSNESYT